jgi:hypothetical protein
VKVFDEKKDAALLEQKYAEPLSGADPATQKAWGVTNGSALNGSFARQGREGFFVDGGKQTYLRQYQKMETFLRPSADLKGFQNVLLIKGGIGGQHTGFEGLSEFFASDLAVNHNGARGEYELGYSDEELEQRVQAWGYTWDRVQFIASSKSGSTDESMIIFAQYLGLLLKHFAGLSEAEGQKLAVAVQQSLRDLNYKEGQENPPAELFRLNASEFFAAVSRQTSLPVEKVQQALRDVLCRIAIETTANPSQSRLAAFAQNAGLYQALGIQLPVIDMFDNVGGRWTIDFHMLPFLALVGVEPEVYWSERDAAIRAYETQGDSHPARVLGRRLLDDGVKDVIFVTPAKTPWLGHTIEQTFNESIYQNGYIHLRAIPYDEFDAADYAGRPGVTIINAADKRIDAPNAVAWDFPGLGSAQARDKVLALAQLFTRVYGLTNTVGFELIARALKAQGKSAPEVDLNDGKNAATQIVIANSHLLQPWVEWAKKSVEKRLSQLQSQPQGVDTRARDIASAAAKWEFRTNFAGEATLQTPSQLTQAFETARELAQRENRRLMVWIYAQGRPYIDLEKHFKTLGVEVWQGTSMQHISANQLHSQAQDFLPFIISLIPESMPPGPISIGFGKAYLHRVPTVLVRDAFAEGTYGVPTQLRKEVGGKAAFLRMPADAKSLHMLKTGSERALTSHTSYA